MSVKNIKEIWKKYDKFIIFGIIFITAFLVRIIGFGIHPGGFNQDEASIRMKLLSDTTHGRCLNTASTAAATAFRFI